MLYNGLEQSMKISTDVVAGGALMEKYIDTTKVLLEEMTSKIITSQMREPP